MQGRYDKRPMQESLQRTRWPLLTEAVFRFDIDLSAFLEQQFNDVLLAPFRCHVHGRDVLLEGKDDSFANGRRGRIY